jgi:hypothetical protein
MRGGLLARLERLEAEAEAAGDEPMGGVVFVIGAVHAQDGRPPHREPEVMGVASGAHGFMRCLPGEGRAPLVERATQAWGGGAGFLLLRLLTSDDLAAWGGEAAPLLAACTVGVARCPPWWGDLARCVASRRG